MVSANRLSWAALVLALGISVSGCSIEKMAVDNMLPLLRKTNDDFNRTTVVAYAQQAGPGLIALINGLVYGSPENAELRLLQAELNFSYAFAFLEIENPPWAIEMYQRSQMAALIALEQEDEDLAAGLESSTFNVVEALSEHCDECTTPKEGAWPTPCPDAGDDFDALPALFWWAFARGAEINLRRGEPGEVATLPRVEAVMQWVLRHDPGYFNAGPHLFFGMRYLSLPASLGGEPEKGLKHFREVNRITKDKNLLVKLLEAQFYAPTLAAAPAGASIKDVLAAQNRAWEAFYGGLTAILEAPADLWPEQAVFNALAKSRAKALLADPEANNVIPPEGAENPHRSGGGGGGDWGGTGDDDDDDGWGD
ncbi:MAG: hypothetical protein JKY65_14260 [Planctomycetes bacterium]|nr:hypothetical protein [Planctomycetota bacterium]